MGEINNNNLTFTLYSYDKAIVGTWWNFKHHISRFARIYVIESGEQIVRFNGKEFIQRPGSIFLMPPFTPVDYICNDQCVQYYFIFTAEFDDGTDLFSRVEFNWQQPSDQLHLKICQHLLDKVPGRGLKNYDANDSNFKSEIFNRDRSNLNTEQELQQQGTIRILLSDFFSDAISSNKPLRFSKVLRHIENNLTGDLSLQSLAAQENMNSNYFSDLFKLNLGIRPSKYVNNRRISMARQLLISTSYSVKEIAIKSGFPDYDYLFRVFKKETGMTPRQYRQKEQ